MASVTCPECDKVCRSESGLVAHIDKHHPVDAPPPDSDAPPGAVVEAVEAAIAAATHLGPQHMAGVAALRIIARQLDKFPVVMPGDVTFPTFLRYLSELGLTPLSTSKLGIKDSKPPGRLGHLRAVQGGRAS